jgi:hypothetical protein
MPNKTTVPTKTSKIAKTNGGQTHQQATTDVLLTTNQGLPISDNQDSLKSGGPPGFFLLMLVKCGG